MQNLLLCIILVSTSVIAQPGVIYTSILRPAYRRRSRSEGYTTSCGFAGWRRCGRTRTVYYREYSPTYSMRRGCANGYSGPFSGFPYCSPICTPNCVNGNCNAPNRCSCNSGYQGVLCNTDKNECAINKGGCDHDCTNTVGSFQCSCNDGFLLNPNQRTCRDIDECVSGNGGCTHTCTNTPGSFRCSCRSGYEFEPGSTTSPTNAGRSCTDINECLTANGDCEQVCTNSPPGSRTCSCNSGYRLESDNQGCADIDECAGSLHNCTGNAQCVNEIGSFRCTCPSGYLLSNEDFASCNDIDECALGLSGCNQICSNTIGSFQCSCNEGYKLSSDNLTCVDIDECELEIDNCHHHCTNTVGSFQCSCSRGFILTTDQANCVRQRCPTLIQPLNGRFLGPCDNRTGGICGFSCNRGYTLRGNSLRVCTPFLTWTGTDTICEPLLCVPLEAPENGAILPPCNQEFMSSCSIICTIGYKRQGPEKQTCQLSSGGVEWSEAPVCIETNPCDPNPCENNGICSTAEKTTSEEQSFQCNCDQTGFEGPTCNRGIVTTPFIPTLIENEMSMFNISAKPQMDLVIGLSAGRAVEVRPRTLVISRTSPTATFQMMGTRAGHYALRYELSGSVSDGFEVPENSPVLVSQTRNMNEINRYFRSTHKEPGFLTESCCSSGRVDFMYGECPMSTESVIFQSTCTWLSRRSVNFETSGIVFAQYKTLSLPLSISGVKIEYDGESGAISSSLSERPISSCKQCPENRAGYSIKNMCYHYPFNSGDVEDFLKSRSLANTYLDRIKHMFPSWLSISLPTRETTAISYDGIDFAAQLVEQGDVSDISGCERIVADDPGLYVVLRYSHDFTISVEGETARYNSSGSSNNLPVCIAVNLCKEMMSPVYQALPSVVQPVIRKLPVMESYNHEGWEFSIESVTFYNASRNLTISEMYWNGLNYRMPELPDFNLKMVITGSIPFTSSPCQHLSIDVDFTGSLSRTFPDGENRRGYLNGDTTLTMLTKIDGKSNNLFLSSNVPAILSIEGDNSANMCTQGLSLRMNYIPRSNQTFFSTLFSLEEITPECEMDIFLNIDHSLTFHGLSMSLNHGCPRIRLDRLLFSQMDHRIHMNEMSSPMSSCYGAPGPELLIQDRIMTIHSTLRNVNSLSLGRFITLNQPMELPAMTIVYSADNAEYKARLYSAVISILGAMINSPIMLSDGSLSFSSPAMLYDKYNAEVRVTASTNVPWERIVLDANVQLGDGEVTDIEEYVQEYIKEDVVQRARMREMRAQMAVDRAEEQLTTLEMEYSLRIEEYRDANTSYQQALSMVESAMENLTRAEETFQNANDELREAEMALNNVCKEEDCMDVDVEREECTMCYENRFTEGRVPCLVPTQVLRCSTVVARVIPRYGYRFVTCCSRSCVRLFFIFFFSSCGGYCRGVCKLVRYYQEVRERRCQDVTELVQSTCPQRSLDERIPTQCCQNVTVSVENTECKEECRNGRGLAVQGLQQSREDLAAPFRALEDARRSLSTTRSVLSRETVRRDNARRMRDQITSPLENARNAKHLSIQNKMKILQEIEKNLRLADQVQGVEDGEIFTVVKASFNATITQESPTQVLISVRYISEVLERNREVVALFDFTSSREINLRKVTETIVQDLLNTFSSRVRRSLVRFPRQVDQGGAEMAERPQNQVQFEENCVASTLIKNFIKELEASLELLKKKNDEILTTLKESIHRLMENMEKRNTADVNLEALGAFLNGTVNISMNMQKETNDYKQYLQQLIEIATNTIKNINSSSFVMWQTSTEVLYNDIDSVIGYPCSGFTDCLEVVTDQAEKLVADLPASPGKARLERALKRSSSDLITLATSMNLSVPDAIEIVLVFKNVTESNLINSYWCSSPPEITEQPPIQFNVSSKSVLILNCSARSLLPMTIHWRKEGSPIPNAHNSTLRVENVQLSESGNYTCVFSNAVGANESLVTEVQVYELPQFFSVLEPLTTVVGNESGAWFSCNASGFPYPGWKWYFKSDLSDPWIEIPDEIINELTIVSPQFKDQGWYTCEAYNFHGYKRAEPVYLTVLSKTVSQLSMGVRFVLSLDTGDISSGLFGGSGDAIRCSIDDLTEIVSDFLTDQIGMGKASAESLNITFDSSAMEYSVSFIVVSKNVTDNDTHSAALNKVQNQALPSRRDVQRVKKSLQGVFVQREISLMCNDHELEFKRNSLNFDIFTYLCPRGQELSSDFLFCVSCPPGQYQKVTEGVRVFNGEGLKEKYPVCRNCPVSTFADGMGRSVCQPCPIYHQTTSSGSKSPQDCYVDPLLIECSTESAGSQVEIDCKTNRPSISTLCSFDGGLEHQCEYPVVINERNGFSPGNHSLLFHIRDNLGFTARTTVNFKLTDEQTITNTSSMVPKLGVHFINRSPRVGLNRVEADFILTRPAASITCQLKPGRRANTVKDCSSGHVSYSDLYPGKYTLRVTAINYKKEDRVIMRRRFEVPPSSDFCTLHLVDNGVEVEAITGNVTIDFDGVGPVEGFRCSLDKAQYSPCMPPVEFRGLMGGDHTLVIDPQGCHRNSQRRAQIKFKV